MKFFKQVDSFINNYLPGLKKVLKVLIITVLLFVFIIYLLDNFPIGTFHHKINENEKVKIKMTDCITCFMDASYKKIVIYYSNNNEKYFRIRTTEIFATKMIMGSSKDGSELDKNNIKKVIIFPSENEILDIFDFTTQRDLNNESDISKLSSYYNSYYYDLELLMKDLNIELDTIFKSKN